MDPFRTFLALGPLAVYLFLLGWINLSSHARVVTGMRDSIALGLALMGFWMIGPIELFLPEEAATMFGPVVWAMVTALYLLVVVLLVLYQRPRLVIYNVVPEQLRPLVAAVAGRIDPASRWAGDQFALPTLGVQARLEMRAGMVNATLSAAGDEQNLAGWQKLHKALSSELVELPKRRNWRGLVMLAFGAAIFLGCYLNYIQRPDDVALALEDFLRI